MTYQQTPKDKIKTITAGSGAAKTARKAKQWMDKDSLQDKFKNHTSQTGICDEDRSMISPDYARNFICDFILGKLQVGISQLNLFE